MEKREELYAGKAKSIYKTDDPDRLIMLFRNDTSAFDGKRIEQLEAWMPKAMEEYNRAEHH